MSLTFSYRALRGRLRSCKRAIKTIITTTTTVLLLYFYARVLTEATKQVFVFSLIFFLLFFSKVSIDLKWRGVGYCYRDIVNRFSSRSLEYLFIYLLIMNIIIY